MIWPVGTDRRLALRRLRHYNYLGLLLIAGVLTVAALPDRPPIAFSVQHDRVQPAIRLADGTIRNLYTIALTNETTADETVWLQLPGLDGAVLALADTAAASGPALRLTASAESETAFRVLVQAPAPAGGTMPVVFRLQADRLGTSTQSPAAFISPEPEARADRGGQ